jgi:hypothetical protein
MFKFKPAHRHATNELPKPGQRVPTLQVVSDSLALGVTAKDVSLSAFETTLVSATAGAEYNLPDGEYVGQRKRLVADVSGSGTAVASTAAKAKLGRSLLSGQTPESVTGLVLDADGEHVLIEWTGAKWNVLYTTGTITAS